MDIYFSNIFKSCPVSVSQEQYNAILDGKSPYDTLSEEQLAPVREKFPRTAKKDIFVCSRQDGRSRFIWVYSEPHEYKKFKNINNNS